MELLHNLWNIVSTEDENLIKYVILTLTFVEIYVTMKLFTSILDINYTKKQRNIYVVVMSFLFIAFTILIPKQFSIFINLIIIPCVVKLVFKTTPIKAILAEIIPMVVMTLFETIYLKICLNLFGIDFEACSNIIIYRVPFMLFIYLTLFILSKIVKFVKLNLNSFESLNKTYKRLLIINMILIIICIGLQFYLIVFYNSTLPIAITIISLVFLLTYSAVSIYSIIKTINLEVTKTNLEQSQLQNKTLELLYNNIRAFKHDFSNIITAFGGYIYAKDMTGLENYYDKILDECHINNNLSTLNPEVINNAAIYNILATKYYKADELGIDIDLQVFINLNNLKMDVYDFSRILGILLDNAIEAASQCEKKNIKIEIRDIKPRRCQILTIENTYLNKDIDISRLSEKGYTSKTNDKENHGIGLWQVAKMVKKHNNVLLDTSKDDEYFRQELAIYYR
ncbi:MAG: GHKL domain-containing protein [Clostridia bacterium]|nr:GHKL domain-containing protein [Clostridia bacterium]